MKQAFVVLYVARRLNGLLEKVEMTAPSKRIRAQLASNKPGEKVHYGVATHAIYTCDENTLLGGKELAEKYNAHLSIHVSETRKRLQTASRNLECIPLSISTALTSLFQKEQFALMVHGLRNPK